MKQHLLWPLAFAAIAATGCPGSGAGTVEGRVTRAGAPAVGAHVKVADLETVTDADGRFVIEDVPSGKQDLTATQDLGADGFIARTTEIQVGDEAVASDLTLPEPVEVRLDSKTSRSISVSWSQSQDPGFREYRLVQSFNRSFSEGGSDPLYVATELDDTGYTDDGDLDGIWLSRNTTYHYRVYVMDEHGLLGGSNILDATTDPWDVHDFAVRYRIDEARNFAPERAASGAAWDGEHLWLTYREEIGGYYDNDKISLVAIDLATGDVAHRFEYTDTYAGVTGLTWDGRHLWMHLEASGARELREIDATTGAVVRTFASDDGIADLDFDGENLLLVNVWNKVEVVDPATGGLERTLDTPFDYSTLRAAAHRSGELWLSAYWASEIAILDPATGAHIGVVDTPFDAGQSDVDSLVFAGDQLIAVGRSRIRVFDVVAIDP